MLNVTHTFNYNSSDQAKKAIDHIIKNHSSILVNLSYTKSLSSSWIITAEFTDDIPLKDILAQPTDTKKHWDAMKEPPFHYNNTEKVSTFWKKHPVYTNTFITNTTFINLCKYQNRLKTDPNTGDVLPHPYKSMEDTPLKNTEFAVKQKDSNDPTKIYSWIYVCQKTGAKCIIHNTTEFPNASTI